jgi:hypothetical protein
VVVFGTRVGFTLMDINMILIACNDHLVRVVVVPLPVVVVVWLRFSLARLVTISVMRVCVFRVVCL